MKPLLNRNDRLARIVIYSFSVVVFFLVTWLERITIDVSLGFDPRIFPLLSAVINSVVAVLLVAALVAARKRKLLLHRNIMLAAICLSVLFLINYTLGHLFNGSTLYGDIDKNGLVDAGEKAAAGAGRWVYFFLLSTHILLAGTSLPFILFTAYRGLTGDYQRHRKLGRITWPLWLYVALTGPAVYLMISQYY